MFIAKQEQQPAEMGTKHASATNPILRIETLSSWWFQSTHLKNISQIGSFPQVGMKIKNI